MRLHLGSSGHVLLFAFLAWLGAGPAAGQAAERDVSLAGETVIRVSYRSAETVYLDAGRLAGLHEGLRLELRREGEPVATVEVVFLADHSASAKLVEEQAEIRPGDVAVPLAPLRPPAAAPATSPDIAPAAGEEAGTTAPRPTATRPRRTRLSGVASFDVERMTTDDPVERETTLTTGRLDLRGRDLGGLPLDLRIRLRTRSLDRDRRIDGVVPESEDRDRLYQLSLAWAPESGRWGAEVGRLRHGPLVGIGYLDGVAGHVRLLPSLELGGFIGSRPELTELGFESEGSRYGVFGRLLPASGTESWEVLLAGVREEDDDGEGRELLVVESRLGRLGRLSLAQTAEIDLGGDREIAGDDGSGLRTLAVALTGELSERSRVVVAYDLFDPRPLAFEEEYEGPASRFTSLLRQGLRASLHLRRASGVDLSLRAGFRTQEDDPGVENGAGLAEDTVTLGLGLHQPRFLGLSWSGDLFGFSNPYTEGLVARGTVRRGFEGGHSVDLTLGATGYREPPFDDERVSGWARLSGWVELPAALFARGEVEVAVGDDREGQRLAAGLGYRF